MSNWSLNQTRFSRSSVKITLGGISLLGAGPPDWTEKIGGDLMFLNSPIAVGKVIGEISSDISIPMIPEMLDTVKQQVGTGYGEIALPLSVSLYEPGNASGIYTISNDAVWFAEDAFKAPAEGALSTLKLIGQDLTDWNGVTAIDLAARATDPGLIGAIFAAAGLIL
jgi:hypothetical protein